MANNAKVQLEKRGLAAYDFYNEYPFIEDCFALRQPAAFVGEATQNRREKRA
jgi:hypothetical protein